MRVRESVRRVGWLLATLVSMASTVVSAQGAGNRVIEDATAEVIDGWCTAVHVEFSFPLRYVSHYPVEGGRYLHVQFDKYAVSDVDAIASRVNENVRLFGQTTIDIDEVTYDPEFSAGTPYLILEFNETVHANVEPGRDFRSVTLLLSTDSQAECLNKR